MSSLLIPPPEDPVRGRCAMARRSRSLGPAQRQRDGARERRRRQAGRPCAWCCSRSSRRSAMPSSTRTTARARAPSSLSTGRAAAVLYWHELGRQVRFEGPVVRSPDAESDAYFASRALREPSQRVEQRAEPAARRPGCARGARGQDRRDQTRRTEDSPAPRFLGRIPAVARSRRALGRRPRPLSRARALRAPARRARRLHLRAGPLELAAAATLARPRAPLDPVRDDHLSVLLGVDRDRARSCRSTRSSKSRTARCAAGRSSSATAPTDGELAALDVAAENRE